MPGIDRRRARLAQAPPARRHRLGLRPIGHRLEGQVAGEGRAVIQHERDAVVGVPGCGQDLPGQATAAVGDAAGAAQGAAADAAGAASDAAGDAAAGATDAATGAADSAKQAAGGLLDQVKGLFGKG